MLKFRNLFVNKYTQSSIVNIYRFLSRFNLILGSNRGEELNSTIMPKEYFKDISNVQIKKGLKVLNNLHAVNEIRKRNAQDYTSFLKSKNKNHISEDLFENHIFLKYPILVSNRSKFFELARKANIIIGDWFLSPLHPVEYELERWYLDRKKYPVADTFSKKIINLPTDVFNNKDVLRFIDDQIEFIE